MSGQIVPGNRNGLTAAQEKGYSGLGSILNPEASLINSASQRNNLPQQPPLNGAARPQIFPKPSNRLSPTSRGFSPTDNFPPRLGSLSGGIGLDNLNDIPGMSPWDKPRPNPFNLDNNDFPSLGAGGASSRPMRDYLVRTPTSPTVTAPGRPPSITEQSGLSHLGSPSPLTSSLSALARPSMMDLSGVTSSSMAPVSAPPGNSTLHHPSLTSAPGLEGGVPGLSSTLPGRNYNLTLRDNNSDSAPFSIQNKDEFPALDNTPVAMPSTADKDAVGREFGENDLRSPFEQQVTQSVHSRPVSGGSQIKYEPATQKLTNVPKSMLTDKYSFLGCTHVLEQIFDNTPQQKSASPDSAKSGNNSNGVTPPPGVSLPQQPQVRRPHFPTLDKDLTKMGLVDGYSSVKDTRLIYRFQSPFANMPCRAQDIDMFVPSEYRTNALISDKLTVIKPAKWNEDLLFWMFYSNPNDQMQLTAADELYRRNWRFHKEKKIWISKTQNIKAREATVNYEEGTFHVWDVDSWKKVPKDMKVEYSKLEDKSPLDQVAPRPL